MKNIVGDILIRNKKIRRKKQFFILQILDSWCEENVNKISYYENLAVEKLRNFLIQKQNKFKLELKEDTKFVDLSHMFFRLNDVF